MTKAYFNHTDQQSIRHGEDFFAVHGNFVMDNAEGMTKLSCIQQRDKRKIFRINQKEYERLSEHIGNFPSVMISPYDTDYINGTSDVRRRYVDSAISQFDKVYLDTLIQYNKVLAQRNALLKIFWDRQQYSDVEMSLWNERMIDLGNIVFQTRKRFLADFLPVLNRLFPIISPGEEISIEYKSQFHEDSFENLLKEARQKDYYSQHSSVGIHKDDFLFTMNTFPVKKFCSQGQQKTFLIVLKLAQFEYVKQLKKLKPLLLLDDVFDKLDAKRVNQLIELVVSDDYGQVFITDTHKERMLELFKNKDVDFNLIEI
jgi:DNA replication and repair protein RecF